MCDNIQVTLVVSRGHWMPSIGTSCSLRQPACQTARAALYEPAASECPGLTECTLLADGARPRGDRFRAEGNRYRRPHLPCHSDRLDTSKG